MQEWERDRWKAFGGWEMLLSKGNGEALRWVLTADEAFGRSQMNVAEVAGRTENLLCL